MIKKTELEFIASLIAVAETRVAAQTALIQSFPPGSVEADKAHEALDLMTRRMLSLHERQAKMLRAMPESGL